MTEHLDKDLLKRYGTMELSAPELIRVIRHLENCDDCYEEFCTMFPQLNQETTEAFAKGLFSLSEDEEEFHLNYEEHLRPFVDEEINDIDREIVESHLMVCGECARHIRELREFKESLELRMLQEAETRKSSQTFASKIKNLWRGFLHSTSARVVFASLLLLVFIVSIWLLILKDRKSSTSQGNTNIAQTQSPSPATNVSPEVNPSQSSTGTATASPSASKSPEAGRAAISLKDESLSLMLDRTGKLSGAESLSENDRRAIEQTLQNQRLEISNDIDAISTDVTRQGGNSFTLLSPAGRILKTDRPVFRWQTLDGASTYIVRVMDENLNVVAASSALTINEWQIDRPLQRGKVYSYEVAANKEGKTILSPSDNSPAVKFKVLGQKEVEQANRVERAGSRLLRVVVYARIGLLDEAEKELRLLQKSNPDSPVLKRLLNQIQNSGKH